MEKISIVVPAYNIGLWLPRCLDSILGQTHENIEVIAVNDGSTDDPRAALDAYAVGHPKARAIHMENGGVTSARLRGVEESTGDWIGFIDGDDEIHPEMYARLLHNAHAHKADISHCGHQVLFPDGRTEKVHGTGAVRFQDRVAALRDLLDGGVVESSLCTKLFRRELFAGLGGFMDPAIRNNEDLLMNYYLFDRANWAVYEDFCPYSYILRRGSASYNRFNVHSLFDPILVRQRILSGCGPEMAEDARRALLRNCLFACGQIALQPRKEADPYRIRARQLLLDQREYFHLLSLRNRILANMVCFAPWSFRLAYGLYVKLFQRQEQH